MIEYYTDTQTPREHESRARSWAEIVRGLGRRHRSRMVRAIAVREGLPPRRVAAWVRWAERSGG